MFDKHHISLNTQMLSTHTLLFLLVIYIFLSSIFLYQAAKNSQEHKEVD